MTYPLTFAVFPCSSFEDAYRSTSPGPASRHAWAPLPLPAPSADDGEDDDFTEARKRALTTEVSNPRVAAHNDVTGEADQLSEQPAPFKAKASPYLLLLVPGDGLGEGIATSNGGVRVEVRGSDGRNSSGEPLGGPSLRGELKGGWLEIGCEVTSVRRVAGVSTASDDV